MKINSTRNQLLIECNQLTKSTIFNYIQLLTTSININQFINFTFITCPFYRLRPSSPDGARICVVVALCSLLTSSTLGGPATPSPATVLITGSGGRTYLGQGHGVEHRGVGGGIVGGTMMNHDEWLRMVD